MDREAKQSELDELRERVRALEAELAAPDAGSQTEWPPRDFYMTYYVLGGFVLGMFGAATSLLFNVVGSLVVHQHPLQLIRVYLTFPLGDEALNWTATWLSRSAAACTCSPGWRWASHFTLS